MRKKDFSKVAVTIIMMNVIMTMMISIRKNTTGNKDIVTIAAVIHKKGAEDADVIVIHIITITIMMGEDVIVAVNPIQKRIEGVTVIVMDTMGTRDHIMYAESLK